MAENKIKTAQDFIAQSNKQDYNISSYEDVETYDNDSEVVQQFLKGKEDFRIRTTRSSKRGFRDRTALCFTIAATGKMGFSDLHRDSWAEEGDVIDPTSIKIIEQRSGDKVRFQIYCEPIIEIE